MMKQRKFEFNRNQQGRLHFFKSDSTELEQIYMDKDCTVLFMNPIYLHSDGSTPIDGIWLKNGVKCDLNIEADTINGFMVSSQIKGYHNDYFNESEQK